MKPTFQNHYNTTKFAGTKVLGESQTVQGESHTIRELFERAAIQGHFPIDDRYDPYIDIENIEDINHMYAAGRDIIDLHEHKKHVEDMTILLEEKIKLQEQTKSDTDKLKKESEQITASKKADSESAAKTPQSQKDAKNTA